jgi:hypothetical protein
MQFFRNKYPIVQNAFMNRNKSTEGDEDREIEVPIEAAEDTRVLPGSNTSKLKSNSTLLSTLEPYQHLLPDLCGMDLNQQKKLQKGLICDLHHNLGK